MDAVEFMKEYNRMCDIDGSCGACDYRNELINQIKFIGEFERETCLMLTMENPEFSVEYVEQWSKEHPKKTRLQDLLKKYPNTPLNIYGTPDFCPGSIGMVKCDNCTMTHRECWDQPLEG